MPLPSNIPNNYIRNENMILEINLAVHNKIQKQIPFDYCQNKNICTISTFGSINEIVNKQNSNENK